MTADNAKTDMLEHSQAKVELYSKYLSTWLNIMRHAESVSRVFIFDLFAGERLYERDRKGSAIVACDVVRNHYYSAGGSPLKITIWFNDNGMSSFEPGVKKIDRLKRIVRTLHVPPTTDIRYSFENYDDVWPRALAELQECEGAKGLFFLDPYGYKDIDPEDLRTIILAGVTEAILFLPISHMYRFAQASAKRRFPGSSPLRTMLGKLFAGSSLELASVYDFVHQLKAGLRRFVDGGTSFVDTFLLQRDASNVYALFFLTSHVRGFEKMLEAKWALDRQSGAGYRKEQSMQLFADSELRSFPGRLLEFISSSSHRTNREIYLFGLEHGFLPKHSNAALRELMKEKQNIERFSMDGQPSRGNYLKYRSPRQVGFRLNESSGLT